MGFRLGGPQAMKEELPLPLHFQGALLRIEQNARQVVDDRSVQRGESLRQAAPERLATGPVLCDVPFDVLDRIEDPLLSAARVFQLAADDLSRNGRPAFYAGMRGRESRE